MNYRHHFHAGNFADLVKHAALLAVLDRLTAAPAPLTVIDTHAGVGLYDLRGDMAVKSGEAAAGVARLMADPAAPAAFVALKTAVARANPQGGVRFYPGSPWLTAGGLRPGDRLVACELRPDDARALGEVLRPFGPTAQAICADGFAAAPIRLPSRGAALAVIDPPFERADDYDRIVEGLAAVLARNPAATVLIWTPLKDLETFDRLLRGIETLDGPQTLVAEVRLRPLDDPLRLNGCALILTHPPAGVEPCLKEACQWVVATLGEVGGEARLWSL